ncbi:MAG: 30S ribosomal protein S19e [Candidatus Aenigmatarchaeota archaeon]
MVTVYDVKPNRLIEKTKEELKKREEVESPDWSDYVKTSAGKERPPEQDDWWFIRTASLLRKVYIEGPIGVNKLRREFSTRKNRGHQPEKTYPAGGKIIRTALQQLEDAGLVEKEDKEGRVVTSEGQSFLDNLAYEVRE